MMNGIDRLSYRSRWRTVAPGRKFALWLGLMLLALTLPPWAQALELLLTAVLTCWLVRISPWRWCRWMALPCGFLLLGVATILCDISRDPQTLWVSLPLGAYWLGISDVGLARANETLWRSLAALAATFWLVLNLPFPQWIQLLTRMRVPRLLVEQMLLIWRFIFILVEEVQAIHRAQTLRFGYRNLATSYRSLAALVGLLFSRVLLRYQQMATALDVKLYQGDFHL